MNCLKLVAKGEPTLEGGLVQMYLVAGPEEGVEGGQDAEGDSDALQRASGENSRVLGLGCCQRCKHRH